MNKKVIWSLVAIVASAIGLSFALQGESYIPQTDTLTFERDINNDEGRPLNTADLVSTEGIRLADVYNPTTKKFAPERLSRYGADRTEQGGFGLTVNFIRKDGGETVKPFQLKSWEYFEQTTRPTRRKEVEDAEPRLAEAINAFVASVTIQRAFGVALDTTEGVTPELATRIRQIIAETRAVQLGSDAKNEVALNLYNITESPYQGGRQRPTLTDGNSVKTSIEWLLAERLSQKNSSVLMGLKAVTEEMTGLRDSRPVLHVITDGLENTDALSVYKTPSLLDEANWPKLDQVANLAGLNLAGLTINLHPLPAKSAGQAKMMEAGLRYLANRLTSAKAQVKIEPF